MRAILTAAAIALLGLQSGQPVRAEPTPELHETPRSHPPFVVHAGGAEPQEIAAPDGKIRLVNVWATWCPPCREEMAALDRLQEVLGARDFEVVAVSVDHGAARDKVDAFFDRVGVENLTPYVADRDRLAGAFAVWGLPTSILFDGNGREIARLVGPAAWDSVDMVAFFLALLERENKIPPEGNAVMPSAALSPSSLRPMPSPGAN